MTMKKYDTLLFDLDGTLTDSTEGILKCLVYALERMGFEVPEDKNRFLGPPLCSSFAEFCGMNEEQMSKIFEPYYTTKSSGTGLGLTVLFKIMKQHGGDVTVHSVRGEGSEFILQIPVPESERFRITDGGK